MNASFKDIDSYISLQPEHARKILTEIRKVIRKAVPDATETISYNMPAYKFHGMLIWFAVFKKHYTFFISSDILNQFLSELPVYELVESGSGIKFPLDLPVPAGFLTKIIKTRAKANLEKK